MKRYARIGPPIALLLIGFLAMLALLSMKSELEVVAYGRTTGAQPIKLYAEAAGKGSSA